jgi:hypothetical protein
MTVIDANDNTRVCAARLHELESGTDLRFSNNQFALRTTILLNSRAFDQVCFGVFVEKSVTAHRPTAKFRTHWAVKINGRKVGGAKLRFS